MAVIFPRHGGTSRRSQAGSSLIEVLVAILLMSFGMLGLAGMQAYSLAAHRSAAYRATASELANELAELIRLNPTALAGGHYDVAMLTDKSVPTAAACKFPDCSSPAVLARADLTDFQRRVRDQLPQGGVMVSRPSASTSHADLWLVWDEPQIRLARPATGASEAKAEWRIDNCPPDAQALVRLPRCFYMKVQL